MKNIHNLVTDAFVNMGLNESDYIVSVTHLYNHDIDVSIRLKNATNTTNSANLYLTMTSNHLLDYQEDNNLFNNNAWDLFCLTFERQID
jgi:hypothetical protein